MSNWSLIIYCGIITYLTRFSMIALIKKEMFNDRIREILSYVPSAIFPAIIFVIDANDYNRLNDAKLEIDNLLSQPELKGKPILILANKQDLPHAYSAAQIVDKLELYNLKI